MATRKQEVSDMAKKVPELEPARILEVELGQPLSAISAIDEKTGRLYRRALCLVRLHTQPLGVVEFRFDEQGVSASMCAQHIWYRLDCTAPSPIYKATGMYITYGKPLPPAEMCTSPSLAKEVSYNGYICLLEPLV